MGEYLPPLQQVAVEQVLGPGVEALFDQLVGGGDVAPQLPVGHSPSLLRRQRILADVGELRPAQAQLKDLLNPLHHFGFG